MPEFQAVNAFFLKNIRRISAGDDCKSKRTVIFTPACVYYDKTVVCIYYYKFFYQNKNLLSLEILSITV